MKCSWLVAIVMKGAHPSRSNPKEHSTRDLIPICSGNCRTSFSVIKETYQEGPQVPVVLLVQFRQYRRSYPAFRLPQTTLALLCTKKQNLKRSTQKTTSDDTGVVKIPRRSYARKAQTCVTFPFSNRNQFVLVRRNRKADVPFVPFCPGGPATPCGPTMPCWSQSPSPVSDPAFIPLAPPEPGVPAKLDHVNLLKYVRKIFVDSKRANSSSAQIDTTMTSMALVSEFSSLTIRCLSKIDRFS